MSEETKLTRGSVNRIIASFLKHIARNWEVYKNNLPGLRRTMMYYNEFAYGIRFLPEGDNLDFNPKYPLLDDLQKYFGDRYTEEIGNLIYDAWTLRREFKPWQGYLEPSDNTPEAILERNPNWLETVEAARHYMYEVSGTGYGWYQGQRMKLQPSGLPDIWYRGFTTVEEFPAQKEFLDTIRDHPGIQLGIKKMEASFEELRQKREKEDRELKELEARVAEADAEFATLPPEEQARRLRLRIEAVSKILDALKGTNE